MTRTAYKPIIGLTTYGHLEDGKYQLPAEYIAAVRRAGGVPVLLPPGEQDSRVYLDLIDGIIFTGGGDLDPNLYNEAHHPEIYNLDMARDHSELEMAREVLTRAMPCMGICRGMQVLNVVLGGTLHQHLSDHYGEGIAHRQPERKPIPHHVNINPDSHLATVLGGDVLDISSWHHQAIKDLGESLKVVASAEDGVIEAVEDSNKPWLLLLQWHPELMAEHCSRQQNLFNELIIMARNYHESIAK